MPRIDFSAVVTAADTQAEAEAGARARARRAAGAYLAQTDWMVVRQAETGQAMPADIRARRAEARQLLSGA